MIWYLLVFLHKTYKSVLAYIDLNDFYFLSMTSVQKSKKKKYFMRALLISTDQNTQFSQIY